MDGRRQPRGSSPPSGLRLLSYSLIVFGGYAVVGALVLTVGQYTGLASPIWPAAGLAFAAVYAWGWRLAPAVLLGSLASNVVTLLRQDTFTAEAFWVVAVIAAGAALQAIVGALLVTRFVGRDASLSTAGSIVAFLGLAGPVAVVINATIATVAQVSGSLLTLDQIFLLWLTWWAGDAIGVVVFAPMVLMFIPEQRDVWQGRRVRVAVPMLLAVLVFLALFVQADGQARQERDLRLQQAATAAAGELQRNMARHQEALEGLGAFFESSEEVTAEEFTAFTDDALERFPNLQAMSWNPLITQEQLTEFEDYQRDEQGFPDYRVTERNSEGELISVGARDEYVPVAFIEPLSDNLAALGFDINSNPTRQEAIAIARRLGVPTATAPIDLVQETGTQKGMLALLPVYDNDPNSPDDPDQLAGFAVGVYRLGDLVSDTFVAPRWDPFEIQLVDVTDRDDATVVADRPAIAVPSYDLTTSSPGAVDSDSFKVYGRTWQVGVMPTSGPLVTPDRGLPISLDVLGLVVLFLLQAFVLLVTGLERAAARQAEVANQEASSDPLTGLRNRRAFIRDLENAWDKSPDADRTSVLMYIDLDHFKAVNDRGGHASGDQLLQSVADVMRSKVRSDDTVARLGGDEFAVILHDCGLKRGVEIARNIFEELCCQTVETPSGGLSVGASIGVTTVHSGDDVDELIRRADEACYEAKRSGGGIKVAEHPSNV